MSRKLITFRRIFRTGVVNFFRNATLASAAIAVMVVTLTIVLLSVVTNAAFTRTLDQITSRIDISVFLKDDVTPQKRDQLIGQLKKLPNVKSLNYASKEQVLENYKKENANNPDLLSAISETENPLPATIQIKPRDLGKLQEIRNYLNKAEVQTLVSDISYKDVRKQAIDKIAHAASVLRRAGVVAMMVFALISVLIIFNTIQMAIFNRRDELTIMRLLGASTSYIRGPFVVEGVIYGVLSALLSVVLIHAAFSTASSALQASSLGLLDIAYANTYFREHFWSLLTLQVGIGILIGAASSVIATRRYLKFKSK